MTIDQARAELTALHEHFSVGEPERGDEACDALSLAIVMLDRVPQLEARVKELEDALERACNGLYNGFEPDNQSRDWHAARRALTREKELSDD